jgi:hypothetical protein
MKVSGFYFKPEAFRMDGRWCDRDDGPRFNPPCGRDGRHPQFAGKASAYGTASARWRSQLSR